jgi:hypothetical protein
LADVEPAGISVASGVIMAMTRRRLAVIAFCAVYLSGASFLAGLVTERIRTDRARVAAGRSHERRQREARERAMRVELQHEAARAAPSPR